ncbi:MAG TPA: hypothetical protein VF517_17060 [Thermoleophilaceae bacterium]
MHFISMPAAWDTTLLSRVQPAGDAVEYVLGRAAAGEPVRVAAPAVLEVTYGYELRAGRDPRFRSLLDWFTHLMASGTFRVVPLDGRAAVVAGRVRAAMPHPPGGRKRDPRSKTMRQAAWLLDIQIAASAFAAGLDVATANRADFDEIAAVLATLFPAAPRLEVTDEPEGSA